MSINRLNKFLNSSEIKKYVTRNDEPEIVTIENGNFVWDSNTELGSQKLILENINFKVNQGQLIAIVGVVGSGKSSLLNAILNEMELISGRVNIKANKSIAYCSQLAWIQNASLRFNFNYNLFKFDINVNF